MENGGEELKLEDFGNNVEIPFEILRNYSYKIINKNENQKNNKEEFKSWVLNNLTDNSGAGPSYISSIEWLSERYFENGKISKKSIFEIEDIDLITKIHLEVKKIQRDKNSFIYNKNAPSYGERYFYSASISKYKEFLLFKNGGTIVKTSEKEQIIESINFNIDSFNENILESGLVFSEKLLTRFIASLLTKPFVLLTGLSGSGKTKIAQSFVQWICEDESQYKIIPVGADWTNREPLLGYPNGLNHKEYILPDSGALSLIIEASKIENNDKPYFLILDEMNLSHVERYFADFLSVMESEGKISLYSGTVRKDMKGNDVPDNIHCPKNLFIIGTVNIDETTYMFSPKVLDRANTIEFRLDESNIKNFFDLPSKIDLSVLKRKGASMAKNFLEIAADNTIDNGVDYSNTLVQFFNELKKVGAEYGYRTAVEMLLLIKKLNTISEISKNECIDIAVMQKLLPKP
jgi:energy-coupling factor transporter ATP-binding protein EcfA2